MIEWHRDSVSIIALNYINMVVQFQTHVTYVISDGMPNVVSIMKYETMDFRMSQLPGLCYIENESYVYATMT